MKIVHDTVAHQFVALDDDDTRMGEIEYVPDGDVYAAVHTWTDTRYRGQGVARALLDALAAYAAEQGVRIQPVCEYVVAAFDAYPDAYAHVAARR